MRYKLLPIRENTKLKLDDYIRKTCERFNLNRISYTDIINRMLDIVEKYELLELENNKDNNDNISL